MSIPREFCLLSALVETAAMSRLLSALGLRLLILLWTGVDGWDVDGCNRTWTGCKRNVDGT